MWNYVLSRYWRNLHRNIEIDRNQRSEELLKLGGGQKIFISRGAGEGGVFPYEWEVRKWGRGNFLGGAAYPSAYYGHRNIIMTRAKH